MADPHFSKVSLLLPLLGEDQGTTFTDYSISKCTITANGDIKTVASKSKYYGSSAFFDGSGDYLTCSDNTVFDYGSSDFTVEGWLNTSIRALDGGVYRTIVTSGRFALATPGIKINSSDGKLCVWWSSKEKLKGGQSIDDGLWHHFALIRSGNVFSLYLDGVLIANRTESITFTQSNPRIGNEWTGTTNAGHWNGHIQDLRITKGVARYTENFTSPTQMLGGAVSGVITNRFGNPCQRKVYVVSRPTDATAPQILAHGLSDPTTGAYELILPTDEEVTRVVVSEDDDPLLNDIVDRVIPG